MGVEVSLSVCICTRNRPEDLRRCLQSIADASRLPEQVIVSDDGDEGYTVRDLVGAYHFAQYQRGPQQGLGANRNACIDAVTCSYIMFVDDDVIVPADLFLEAARYCIQSSTAQPPALISGVEYKHLPGEIALIEPGDSDFWGYQRVLPKEICRAIVINAAIFPASLFRVARFDPLLRYGSDEIDMAHHAIAHGYQILYEPSFFVNHYPSEINRDEYATVIEASRIYATAKDYWSYQKNPAKAIVFALLAPPKLVGSLVRRSGLRGIAGAFQATVKAMVYMMAAMRSES